MMRCFGVWVLLMMLGAAAAALMVLSFTSSISNSASVNTDVVFTSHGNVEMTTSRIRRKLKEESYNRGTKKNEKDPRNIKLDDYHPVNPVPSSKSSITNGPIEHGTPLMPFIPRPAPPSHPRRGGGGSGSPAPT
ncbi:hypothetical protein GIB67_005917 [Kingdonia uniflora]|uniref:CLAVATA3/ESR (CLE)-related protein n=1 Tax=Kingdonia uniflora TaxID=39325 RepID=A0A7J7MBJ8_9MAGN|nr:hypothetical protein GIB67_005917 [Kingdonia uniflora]